MYKGGYLVIAGISKAGTTSLFDYLAEHPEIRGSFIKQTFFFLDRDLQKRLELESIYDYHDGLEVFDKYFETDKESKYRLEATPDYLYSPNTPSRLKNFFLTRRGKVIFILRNPVSRFISFFYYGKQQGLIPRNMSLGEFYEEANIYTEDENPCLMAYKTGFYFSYIKNYIDLLGKEKVKVLFFEDMTRDPRSLMKRLARDFEIDESFYDSFDFKIKNQTVEVRSQFLSKLYNKYRSWYIDRFYRSQSGVLIARILKGTFTKAYKRINFAALTREELDINVVQKLRQDYKKDIARLEALMNEKTQWT